MANRVYKPAETIPPTDVEARVQRCMDSLNPYSSMYYMNVAACRVEAVYAKYREGKGNSERG